VGYGSLIIGTPIGLILLIINLVSSNKNKQKRFSKKLVLILIFAGPTLLVGTFILWAIVQLISVFFGINLPAQPLQ
jgi:hypothetical protein